MILEIYGEENIMQRLQMAIFMLLFVLMAVGCSNQSQTHEEWYDKLSDEEKVIYDEGYMKGYDEGYLRGVQEVVDNPSIYDVYSEFDMEEIRDDAFSVGYIVGYLSNDIGYSIDEYGNPMQIIHENKINDTYGYFLRWYDLSELESTLSEYDGY